MTVSALTGDGLAEAWAAVEALAAARRASGAWEARRRAQAEAWFAHALEAGLIARLTRRPGGGGAAAGAGGAGGGGRDRARTRRRRALLGGVRARGDGWGRFFENDLHDEFGSWPLGYTATGGPDIGVIAAVAAAVGDGDDGAFYDAWMAAGDRSPPRRRPRGRRPARRARCRLLLWASACYATSYHPLYGAPVDPRLVAAFRTQIAAFDRGLALLPRPGGAAADPVRGRRRCPATCCRRAGREDERRPLVILTNGYDATVTEMYFAVAVRGGAARLPLPVLRRSRARASSLIEQGMPMRPDWETVIRPVVDFALTLPSVDPRPDRALGLEPRRLPGAARRQRRAAACRLHRRSRPARGVHARDARRGSG